MLDSDNLRTASLYINNQLLSRGLLRDGRGIDFADPGDTDEDVADTMGRVMGVVNDLILRRDRDAEHRESLSTTLRTLRADSLRQSDNFSRLQEKYTEAQRKIALHEAEDNALRAQLKAAEASIHKLKEEAARAKRLVAETRAACANEVRKRDRQIDGLKRAAADAGRARGERRAPGITTVQVVGEVGGEDVNAASGISTADEGYDLRQETNGFLAQLAKGLNEENETLLGLIRTTGDSLKEMSGWDKTEGAAASKREGHAISLVTTPEDIAADIEAVLDHLRTMLTNPSFVPLEEVVVREEEISRLRDGWEKMQTRWRETVHLIDGWHRRMAANGRPVDMEELQMGLRMSPVRVQSVDRVAQNNVTFALPTLQEEEEEEEEHEEDEDEESDVPPRLGSPIPAGSLHLVPAPGYEEVAPNYEDGQELDDSDAESSIFHDDVDLGLDIDMDESQDSEPNVEILQQSTDEPNPTTSMPVLPSQKTAPLEESNVAGNRRPSTRSMEKSRKRSGEHMADNTNETAEAPPPPPHGTKLGQSPQKRLKVSTDSQEEKPKSRPDSAVFTNYDSSLESVKPSPDTSVSRTSSKTTAKSTRSEASAKKEAAAPRKPTTRATRAAAAIAPEQPKKDAPARPVTRQRTTRATAPTSSSSARNAVSKPAETSKSRAPPAPTNTSTDMAPPPRPNKSSNASPHNDKPLPSPPPPQENKKKPSPANKKQPPPIATTIPAEPSTTSSSSGSLKRTAPTAPDSPTRSPGKSTSRLPLPRNAGTLPQPQQSPLSMARIAAKLAASEREADAARVKAKLRAARLKKVSSASGPAAQVSTTTSSAVRSSKVPSGGDSGDSVKQDKGVIGSLVSASMTGSGASYSADENGHRGGVSVREDPAAAVDAGGDGIPGDPEQRQATDDAVNSKPAVRSPRKPMSSPRKTSPMKGTSSPAKEKPRKREVRSRADRVANRRRSTLSPWELQSLISGEVVPPTPSPMRIQQAEQE
ncbi:hypothetical protein VM1G_10002 [Cytospora mali]|uniref:NIMA interactive protein n=1 Tax=Cytospora mali TaxID=578113 RepID=A0A194WE09_CYTMA|nr:hypothetical protein VM1G_10002 [Valsa mali]